MNVCSKWRRWPSTTGLHVSVLFVSRFVGGARSRNVFVGNEMPKLLSNNRSSRNPMWQSERKDDN